MKISYHCIKSLWSWNVLWLAVVGIGIGVFMLVTPKYTDDYWYMENMRSWHEAQMIDYPNCGGDIFRYGIPWERIGETVRQHYAGDTARVCNMVGAFMVIFPKWVGSLPPFIAFLFTIWGAFRLSGVEMRRSWLTGIGIAMWVLTMLWHETMGSDIFQYNYIVSGGLCTGVLLMLRSRPGGVWGMIGFVLLTLLTALWHEGFTVPLLAGLVVLLIFYRESRNRWTVTAALILSAGVLWHFCGTSTLSRGLISDYSGLGLKRLFRNFYYHRAMWAAAVCVIVYVWKRGWRSYLGNRLYIFLTTGIIVALGQAFIVDLPRAAWWGDVASVMLTLNFLRSFDGRVRGYKGWRGIVAGTLLLLSGAGLTAMDINAVQFARELPEVIRRDRLNPEGYQFSKVIDYPWISLPLLQLIHSDRYTYAQMMRWYYGNRDDNTFVLNVVPEGLRHVKGAEGEPLKEGSPGFIKVGRYVIAPSDSTRAYICRDAEIDYGWFEVKHRDLYMVPFVSEGDGRRYVYVMPRAKTEYNIGNIKGIRLK